MLIRLLLLLALSCAFTGCEERPRVPWSLKGTAVPDFKIVSRENLSADGQVTFSLSVVVQASLTKEELTLVSQRIIETLPRHNLAIIFYYSDARDVDRPFTVGKAWWGVTDPNQFPAPGDYSHNVLEITRS
ncbi:MAG: hypothetical protein K0R17_1887 [Rariglobus sp.]|jgi:hypothetical protein|nr:hypothetical protein [Rariglobus sp.]